MRGELDAARSPLEESITIASEIGSDYRLSAALLSLGQVESAVVDYDRAAPLLHEALALYRKLGNIRGEAVVQQTLAAVSLLAGRIQEARELLLGTLDYATGSKDTEFLANTLEMFACTNAGLGDMPQAARLAGAAEALRQRAGIPLPQPDVALLERFFAPARAAMAPGMWDSELAAGRALTQEQAAGLLRSAAHRERA
jgi:tetratricopeptide (TPR) repeat protein